MHLLWESDFKRESDFKIVNFIWKYKRLTYLMRLIINVTKIRLANSILNQKKTIWDR
jgi:hypothetical protein